MRLLDALFGGFRWYRPACGGKWEHVAASCMCPVDGWQRVELFRPRHWPYVMEREANDAV